MLEVLVPTPISNVRLIPGCLDLIESNTGVPFRVTVLVDGGLREDFSNVESFLAESKFDWRLLHNQPPIYLNRSIAELGDQAEFEFAAIIRPEARVDDEGWVGKWRSVFSHDHRAAMVDFDENSRSSSLPPNKRSRNQVPRVGCRALVMRTSFLKQNPPGLELDPVVFFHDRAHQTGHNTWHHPGVRISVVDHKEHRLWPAQSDSRVVE